MGSATGMAGGIAPNLKHNSIMRLAPQISKLPYTIAVSGRGNRGNVPPEHKFLELKE